MKFTARPQTGYSFNFTNDGPHRFCGPNEIPGAGCPNCSKPLFCFANFDATDERLELGEMKVKRVPLLWCWRCGLPWPTFVYRILPEGGVDLVEYGVDGVWNADSPAYFPERRFTLEPISQEQADETVLIYRYHKYPGFPSLTDQETEREEERILNFQRIFWQVGGIPWHGQFKADEDVTCPICGDPMPFFAMIGDSAFRGYDFSGRDDADIVFNLCRKCAALRAVSGGT